MSGPSRSERRRIGIWGHFHGANLGDDLVVTTLIRELQERYPDGELVAFSLNPADTRVRHGIDALPLTRAARRARLRTRAGTGRPLGRRREPSRALQRLREHGTLGPKARRMARVWRRTRRRARQWFGALLEPAFAIESLRALRSLDLLVVAGSGPLYDGWNGPWVHPYNLYKWTLLAGLAKTPVHMLSVGAGPIDSPLSRFFLAGALRLAAYVSYRDLSSRDLVATHCGADRGPVVPDQAFALKPPRALGSPPGGQRVVGVNPMAHADPRHLPRGERARYERYAEKMAHLVAWLLDEGYEVRLFYSALSDLRVCRDLETLLRMKGRLGANETLLDQEFLQTDQLCDEIQRFDFAIAARYHCVLLSATRGVPVLALAYHPKTADLMGQVGQSRYALDIDEATSQSMIDAFRDLVAGEQGVRLTLRNQSERCRARVQLQYNALYGERSTRE